jgi:SNF2 family DNA or RNA helicase
VVFSEWTTHLNLIEIALQKDNFRYVRLDGSMSSKKRGESLKSLEEDPTVKVFLATTGAGGVGLNLTAANYVFMMEPQYNPQKDQQAIDRVHRIGQTRKVQVIRLLMKDSIEVGVVKIAEAKAELAKSCLSKNAVGVKEQKKIFQEISRMLKGKEKKDLDKEDYDQEVEEK